MEDHLMRRPVRAYTLVLALSTLCVAASASAYEIRLVPTTPLVDIPLGGLVRFEAYLDTQGESDIVLFSTSLVFDDEGFDYRPDLSDANDQLLYSTGGANGSPPELWLNPSFNAGCCDPPAQWAGLGPAQVQLNFALNILGTTPQLSTLATATNAWVGTLVFEAVRGGSFTFDWGFGHNGNVFARSDLVDIQDQISTPVAMVAHVIPEPKTALLFGTGLAGLALTAKRRRR